MAYEPENEDVRTKLQQLGIVVAQEDIAFLQRSFIRQRELLRRHTARLSPETEPAHVFKPPSH